MDFWSILSGIRLGIKKEIVFIEVGTTTAIYTKKPIKNTALIKSFNSGIFSITLDQTTTITTGIISNIILNIITPFEIVGSLHFFSIGRILLAKDAKPANIITIRNAHKNPR